VLADKASGVWADHDRVHPAGHVGEHFRVAGPLNLPRSPQGRPVLVQAGSSRDGRDFAARHAEAIFTAQQTLEDAQEFYADIKDRARRLGRDPDRLLVLPGIVPAIGSTEAEARALEEELDRLISPEYARGQLARTLRVDPEDLRLDEQLPADLPDEDQIEGAKSRYTLIVTLARRERLTVRQLFGRLGGGRGHRTFSGTPEQVADAIEEWFTSGAADGFNIMPPVLPAGLDDFIDQVVPILRRRGLFRSEYEGPTLRQLLASLAGARGHFTFAGTPEQVADLIEDWFTDGAADGFNIMPPLLPAMLDVFSAEVIPILQRRGLFRTAYQGRTLREHYGLAWPESAFAEPVLQES
jgi:FMN-dependent oxidoreductase (nitrilotriacetate monooxygenase family)